MNSEPIPLSDLAFLYGLSLIARSAAIKCFCRLREEMPKIGLLGYWLPLNPLINS